MQSYCSSQKQNPFFSGNPQKFHNPFLGSASMDEMFWVRATDFRENSMQQKSNSLPFVILGGGFLKNLSYFKSNSQTSCHVNGVCRV